MPDRPDYGSAEYKSWRFAVMSIFGWTCCLCNKKKEKDTELHAHHIKTYSKFPNLRYAVNNGCTLCAECHSLITGREEEYEDYFKRLVKEKIRQRKILRKPGKVHKKDPDHKPKNKAGKFRRNPRGMY